MGRAFSMERTLTTPTRVQRILMADEAILRWIRSLDLPRVTHIMRYLTRVGDATSWIVFGLILFGCGGPAHTYGMLLSLGALIATAFAQTLKRICRRTRPSMGIRGFTALAENPDTF